MSHSNSYDEVEYLSMPIRETDPLVMATLAALFGVDAADPRSCDILELGCGDGGNLFSLASSYPGIRAIGFDPAHAAVQRGRDVLERIGLSNVELHHDDAGVDLEGTMDYVYAHGVLSWVDEDVCADIVASAARAARPGGLVSFSYRVFPYAYYELPAREMAQRAIQEEERRAAARGETLGWSNKIRIARERIALAASLPSMPPHNQAMQVSNQKWAGSFDWALFHDDLSEPLHPKRTTDVVELAAAHGLTYVGELLPTDLWQYWFVPDLCKVIIDKAGPDAVRRRQLADDLAGSAFHSSLFVKADEAPSLDPSFGDREFHVRQYVHDTSNGAQLSDQISAGVAEVIRKHHPASVTAGQIAEELGTTAAQVESDLLQLYTNSLVQLSTVPPPVAAPPGDRPRTMPLVIEQINQRGSYGSSRFHVGVELDRSARTALLKMTDGTRDRAALRRELTTFAAARGMADGLSDVLSRLDEVLEELALAGLLADPN